MDRPTALNRLPKAYAEALRLRDAGLDDEAIAGRLAIPPEAITLLMQLAEAKLRACFRPSAGSCCLACSWA